MRMDTKTGFLGALLVIGVVFALYGNYVAAAALMYLGMVLIAGVAGIFGVTVTIQNAEIMSALLTIKKDIRSINSRLAPAETEPEKIVEVEAKEE